MFLKFKVSNMTLYFLYIINIIYDTIMINIHIYVYNNKIHRKQYKVFK